MSHRSLPSPEGDVAREFGVYPRWRRSGTVVLTVVGEVDLLTAPSLLEAARAEFGAGCRSLVLDLAGVEFCSARCIGTLIEVRRLAEEHGAAVRFAHPSAEVRRIAGLVGAGDVIEGDVPPATAPPVPRGRRTAEPESVTVSGAPWGRGWSTLATVLRPAGGRPLCRWRTGSRGRRRRRPVGTAGRG
jgi:anti-sigma B factor antagonist